MPVRRRFLSPAWLILSLPLYLGLRLLPGLTQNPWGIGIGVLVLIAACVLIRRRRRGRSDWAAPIAMGFFSTLFVMAVLRDVALLGVRVLFGAAAYGAFVRPSALAVLVLTALFTGIGFLAARRPRLVHVDIPIERLPLSLHGFAIAQISDVHVGPTIRRRFVERLVARVNDLKADLIAVTGDLVDGSVEQLSNHTAPLSGLSARHGAFFVTGNHEYYSGEPAWTREIRRLGLTVLKNEHVVLQHDGALAGAGRRR